MGEPSRTLRYFSPSPSAFCERQRRFRGNLALIRQRNKPGRGDKGLMKAGFGQRNQQELDNLLLTHASSRAVCIAQSKITSLSGENTLTSLRLKKGFVKALRRKFPSLLQRTCGYAYLSFQCSSTLKGVHYIGK